MTIIKSYTDYSQSKVLTKILSGTSADMYYYTVNGHSEWYKIPNVLESIDDLDMDRNSIPCWSLSALLNVLPEIQGAKPIITLDDNYITYPHMSGLHTKADNLIDACYEMILKLHEQKIL